VEASAISRNQELSDKSTKHGLRLHIVVTGGFHGSISHGYGFNYTTLAPGQEIRSRGFQLFDEQRIVRQPQPSEQFQVGDDLAQSVSITTGPPPTVSRYGLLNESPFFPD